MNTINQILLIEDDKPLARSISTYLTINGFEVRHFSNGDNLENLIASNSFSLILCDIMLPGTDGFEIAKKIRHKFKGPYIFLTALRDLKSELKAFELGADDYICKPVKPELLLARIKAHLNRTKTPIDDSSISFTNLIIDKSTRTAFIDNTLLPLSRYEFDLLWLLAVHKEQQVNREFLFVNTVGREYNGLDRTIDSRVSRLRKKLESFKKLKCKIRTSWGQGYMLAAKGKS